MLTLVLPAYNKAEQLPTTLARCLEHFRSKGAEAEIIVVDDGSTDDTMGACREAFAASAHGGGGSRYVRIEHRGKGAAVRTGVMQAKGDPIAFLDADLDIPIEVVDDLLNALDRGADIAVASRYVPGSQVHRPWRRRIMSHAFRWLVRFIVPTGVQDTQCGGKAYRAEVARDLFERQRLDGFAFDTETLFLARRAGYRIAEVPFTLERHGRTSIDFIRETPVMVADLVRIRLHAALGRYDR